MEEITLDWLEKEKARCAIKVFKKVFGTKASVKDVLEKVRELNRPAWEAWLLSRDVNLTKCLLGCGANIHVYGDFAIRVAIAKGRLSVVKCLVENGARVRMLCNCFPIELARQEGHVEVVEYINSL